MICMMSTSNLKLSWKSTKDYCMKPSSLDMSSSMFLSSSPAPSCRTSKSQHRNIPRLHTCLPDRLLNQFPASLTPGKSNFVPQRFKTIKSYESICTHRAVQFKYSSEPPASHHRWHRCHRCHPRLPPLPSVLPSCSDASVPSHGAGWVAATSACAS